MSLFWLQPVHWFIGLNFNCAREEEERRLFIYKHSEWRTAENFPPAASAKRPNEQTNVHFSKVRRPAERVQSERTLALLPLRLTLLLQVSTWQIQAAVNLIETHILPHHQHYPPVKKWGEKTTHYLLGMSFWCHYEFLFQFFNFGKSCHCASSVTLFPQSRRGAETKRLVSSEQVQCGSTHPPRPPAAPSALHLFVFDVSGKRAALQHSHWLPACHDCIVFHITALQRRPLSKKKRKRKSDSQAENICKAEVYI